MPDLDEDGPALLAALAAIGVAAHPVRWDDPAVEWSTYDLVVIRSTWDYLERREEFIEWTRRVPRLRNSAAIVAWNTHKSYLSELAAAGIPTVPTIMLQPGDPAELPTAGEYVVKPAVGAGARHTARYGGEDAAAAQAHIAALQSAGRDVMVQPYLSGVDEHGETGLLFLDGTYSHSIRKAPLLTVVGDDGGGEYRGSAISARTPEAAELALAQRVLQAVPDVASLLYARVDLVPGPAGSPLLLELELTEPSLFLSEAAGAADRFATAIAAEAAHR